MRDKIAILRYMRDKNISDRTRIRVTKYLDEFFEQEGAREFQIEERVLSQLGPELKHELFYEAFGKRIAEVNLFKNFSPEFIRALAQFTREMRASNGEKIIRDKGGQKTQIIQKNKEQKSIKLNNQSIFFIMKGQVAIHPNISKDQEIISLKELGVYDYFGEYSFFTGLQHQVSASSSSDYTHLFYIDRSDFLTVLEQFPKDFEIYCMMRDQLLFSQQLPPLLVRSCYTCQKTGHISSQCPSTHFISERKLTNSRKQQERTSKKKQSSIGFVQIYKEKQEQILQKEQIVIKNLLKNMNEEKPEFQKHDILKIYLTPPRANKEDDPNQKQEVNINQEPPQLLLSSKDEIILDEWKNYHYYFPDFNLDALVFNFSKGKSKQEQQKICQKPNNIINKG